jgi:hypothetical protein
MEYMTTNAPPPKKRFNITLMVAVGLAVLVSLIAIMASSVGNNQSGDDNRVNLTFELAPTDAVVTVNNESIESATKQVMPGEYLVTVSREGFSTIEDQVSVTEDTTLTYLMTPTNQTGRRIVAENSADFIRLESFAGRSALQEGRSFAESNPITTRLPYTTLLYTIGYRMDASSESDDAIIVEVFASDGYREPALQQIRNWGIDPTELSIEFINYRNPFNE